jgi:Flp pilus assembly protein TadC
MLDQPAGPTLLGFDVIMVGTILAGLAAFAMVLAIYAAVTIRDPMAKRVKVLEARREQLKAGIVTSSAKKRTRLARRNDTTDKVKESLGKLNVLQESQIKVIQQKLAHAGYRNKELAFLIIGARAILPIVVGGLAALLIYGIEYWPDWGPMTRLFAFAGAIFVSYKGPEIFLSNKAAKRTKEIQKGLPDALDLLVICAEAGLTVDAAFNRVAKELGRAYPELGDEFALTAIELSFLNERKMAFNNLAYRVDLEAVKGVVTTMIQTERYGTPLASALRVLSAEFRNERMMRAEEKAARLPAIMTVPLNPVHPADAVCRYSWPGSLFDLGRADQQLRDHRRLTRRRNGRAGSVDPALPRLRFAHSLGQSARPRVQTCQKAPKGLLFRRVEPGQQFALDRQGQRHHLGMDSAAIIRQFEQVRATIDRIGHPRYQPAFLQHLDRTVDRDLVHQGRCRQRTLRHRAPFTGTVAQYRHDPPLGDLQRKALAITLGNQRADRIGGDRKLVRQKAGQPACILIHTGVRPTTGKSRACRR